MEIKDFGNHFKNKINNAVLGQNMDELTRRAAVKAVEFYKMNFRKQAFVNNGEHPWQELKKRKQDKKKGVPINHKILTGTGDLARSIKFKSLGGGQALIYSEKVYANVHNEGLRAGRGKGFVMPKRQFVGDSKELRDEIDKMAIEFVTKKLAK
jgi:phage gpG-like protein